MQYNTRIRNRRQDKGLVLILVVALCTILAILGSTFLFIARTDRRRTAAVEYRQRANFAAQALVEQVRAILKEDLHLGVNRAYENLSADAGVAGIQFMDFGLEFDADADPATQDADLHLATFDYWNGHWPVLTNLTGEADTAGGVYADVPITDGDLRNVTGYRDSAGTLLDEARLVSDGQLYAAVRVVDLGGLMNVNTGYTCTTPLATTPGTQACIGLKEYLEGAGVTWGDTSTWAFNTIRCGSQATADSDAVAVYSNLAYRLYDPASPAQPYAVGDEAYLRFLGTNGESISGRLKEQADLTPDVRRHLTTFNVSRGLTRYVLAKHDGNDRTQRYYVNDTAANKVDGLTYDADGARVAVYDELVAAGMPADDAAHWVANLYAYLDGQDVSKAYEFRYNDGATNKTAYGVVPQPFIAEAYAVVTADTTPLDADHDDGTWGSAIEVWNPYSQDLDVFIGDRGSLVLSTATAYTIPAGTRRVFYSWGKGPDAPGTVDADSIFGVSTSSWVDLSDVDFITGNRAVSIIRRGASNYGGGDIKIVLDTVSADDMGFTTSATTSISSDEAIDLRRDDNVDRHRYAVAACKHLVAAVGHSLGSANNVDTTQVPLTECYAGFDLPIRTATNIADLNELLRFFRAGPNSDGDALTEQLDAFKTDTSRGRLNVRGTLAGNTYPAVPLACLIGEFFDCLAPDTTDGQAPGGSTGRYYGRVNINTATQDVLEQLPWPRSGSVDVAGIGTITFADTDTTDSPFIITPEEIAKAIIDYRDGIGTLSAYTSSSSTRSGFLTPGELAYVLAEFMDEHFKDIAGNANSNPSDDTALTATQRGQANYLAVRDLLYSYVSNLICTQSDVYAVYIRLQDKETNPNSVWYYLAVIDRSNCETFDDEPALLMFTPLR